MGSTPSTVNKDADGNVKYNTDSITVPYVTQGQWSTPGNYSFLDSRYAPVSGGGFVDKTSFDSTLTGSTPYKSLSSSIDSVNTKYTNMQSTYNSNFSTIAANLGMATTNGVVSGSVSSSTFVTQSNLNSVMNFGTYTYGSLNNSIQITSLTAIKTGKLINYIARCKIYPDFVAGLIDLRKMITDNTYISDNILSITIQDQDSCGSALKISSNVNSMMCSHVPVHYPRVMSATGGSDDGRWAFYFVRNVSLVGNGENISEVNFTAIGYKN